MASMEDIMRQITAGGDTSTLSEKTKHEIKDALFDFDKNPETITQWSQRQQRGHIQLLIKDIFFYKKFAIKNKNKYSSFRKTLMKYPVSLDRQGRTELKEMFKESPSEEQPGLIGRVLNAIPRRQQQI